MRPPRAIAITGATGFFGWHLRSRLLALAPQLEVRLIGHREYDDDALLASTLANVDAVVHLAGANRGSDDVVHDTNIALAERLVGGLDAVGGSPYVIYADTIHAVAQTAYGTSKRQAGEILASWGRRAGAPVGDFRFPNLFGEGGRPHYNSAVATFCHQLALGEASDVNEGGRTELLHAQDASAILLAALADRAEGSIRVEGREISIPMVYERLSRLRADYHGPNLPELSDRLDLQLFNTLRTAMFPQHYPVVLDEHSDARGVFVEAARGMGQTQTSYATTRPGRTRGDHFHLDKVERFVVMSGRGVINLRQLFSDEVFSFTVSGDAPVAVDMPPLYAHNLTNLGVDDLVAVFWANDHFESGAPDTYREPVERVAIQVEVGA